MMRGLKKIVQTNQQRRPIPAPVTIAITAIVGLGSAWGVPEWLHPSPAQAYTAQSSVYLYSPPDESYETLLNRSHLAARAAVQRSFDADLLVSEAFITIVADRDGITVPIMEVTVSRSAWRNRPDAAYWGNYFLSARSLLGFTEPATGRATSSPANAPVPSNPPAPSDPAAIPGEPQPGVPNVNGGDAGSDASNNNSGDANNTNSGDGSNTTRDTTPEPTVTTTVTNENLDRLPGVTVTLPEDPFNPLPTSNGPR